MKKSIVAVALFLLGTVSISSVNSTLWATPRGDYRRNEVLVYTKDYLLLRKVIKVPPEKIGQEEKFIIYKGRNYLVLVDFDGNECVNLSENVDETAVSPDKNRIAYTECGKNGLWVYDFSQKTTTQITEEFAYSINFSSDSTKVSYISIKDKNIVVYSVTIDDKNKELIYISLLGGEEEK